jgi:hypothetical protein
MYIQCNIEVRACNHSCRGTAISTTYSECMFVALVTQYEKLSDGRAEGSAVQVRWQRWDSGYLPSQICTKRVSFVMSCLSVRLSAYISAAPNGRISVKFDTGDH